MKTRVIIFVICLLGTLTAAAQTKRALALGDLLPWTELEKEYNSRLDNQKKGAYKVHLCRH